MATKQDHWDERFPPLPTVPAHVGIIMDGNGRWAQQQGKPRSAGHRAGVENLRRVLEASVRFGIQTLTIYAFSTENWDRPAAEVNTLIGLLAEALRREAQALHEQGVRLCPPGSPGAASRALAARRARRVRDDGGQYGSDLERRV